MENNELIKDNKKASWWIVIIIFIILSILVILNIYLSKNLNHGDNSNGIPMGGDRSFILRDDSCEFQKSGEYKVIDIATTKNRIYTQSVPKYTNYTRSIQVSGNINNIWLCVIADISDKSPSYNDYRKPKSYYGMIYVYFNPNNMGYINVAYYKPNGEYYDYNSDSSHTLGEIFNGKFWSSETPKRFVLDLNNVIIANTNNNIGYNYISPSSLFISGATLKVGGFMTSLGRAYRASSISSYRIIYNGSGEIILN